ncbi:MAG: YbaB/EbfC family nucleoid-associated protein [Cyanobacteria bacterium]|uniref:YbaB/EbfC family nucleoid-associated protein n=1 Tax=Geminocystis sp. TaxID=2664100 RepID=UPI001DFA6F7E|nr:YbaB/EbfC family nucleoid-associated protein [Cyanobacteria bacterium CG_2015-16_32_12]NCO78105.1 YbaB/EbfC family nucleoid-associated protein [Cyanobacteria bacterium CG_2015-22_32_23]NCQ04030.1 YbaB/EbfC family nucleoid-associated protein [Cyanobacteria bacterium CG_2015-09_32_10]NCQ42731.1 YbaB/EbfC family nucleoid-associated protein [Cyanobacteria bacterium CG_2015-04_32_10]NCS84033.1 YbaB/EbfC family nucleoid-associated protein [Cyanobacteria bacterium CG_2015-02_32_10]
MNNQGKGFGFGLGKMKELANAFQKAQQIQEDAANLQKELEVMRIEGQSADGLVVVIVSGNQEPQSVEIKDEALTKTASELSEIVTEAVKDAHQKSTEIMREKMEALTGNLGLPGM